MKTRKPKLVDTIVIVAYVAECCAKPHAFCEIRKAPSVAWARKAALQYAHRRGYDVDKEHGILAATVYAALKNWRLPTLLGRNESPKPKVRKTKGGRK